MRRAFNGIDIKKRLHYVENPKYFILSFGFDSVGFNCLTEKGIGHLLIC